MCRIGEKDYIKIKKKTQKEQVIQAWNVQIWRNLEILVLFSVPASPLGGFGKLGKVYLKTKFQVEQVLCIQAFRFGGIWRFSFHFQSHHRNNEVTSREGLPFNPQAGLNTLSQAKDLYVCFPGFQIALHKKIKIVQN